MNNKPETASDAVPKKPKRKGTNAKLIWRHKKNDKDLQWKQSDNTIMLSDEDQEFAKSMVSFEDKTLIILNKPTGLASQAGSGVTRDLDHLLWAFANRKGRRPKLVHRLDRETSGLVLVAQTTPGAAFFSEEFAQRRAKKTYYAIISGVPAQKSGTIDAPLKRARVKGIDLAIVASVNDKNGQTAITDYEVISSGEKVSFVKLSPQTGRMHQLRAHLTHFGHPIVGDTKYGGLLAIGPVAVPRLMLHAETLEIAMPESGTKKFSIEIADDMKKLLADLGLAQG